jgi:hypothetical protein
LSFRSRIAGAGCFMKIKNDSLGHELISNTGPRLPRPGSGIANDYERRLHAAS